MRTAIDANIFSAIWSNEPSAPQLVQSLATARANGALVISGPVFAEIHGYPRITPELIHQFLQKASIWVDFQLSGKSGAKRESALPAMLPADANLAALSREGLSPISSSARTP